MRCVSVLDFQRIMRVASRPKKILIFNIGETQSLIGEKIRMNVSKDAEFVAQCASFAVLLEVSGWPKPVARRQTG